uniref:Uncharacterized protein n=1 Tax=Triticum urartu TaxID=4572 RepID=A0A8R7USA8_TRIUA
MAAAASGTASGAPLLAFEISISILRKNCTRWSSSSRAASRRFRSIRSSCSPFEDSTRSYVSPSRRIACARSRRPCARSLLSAPFADSSRRCLLPFTASASGSGGNPSDDSDDADAWGGDGSLRFIPIEGKAVRVR